MIDGLEALDFNGQPGVAELRGLLEELLGGRGAEVRLIDHEILQPRARRVLRLCFEVNAHIRSVVVKRLKPEVGRRTELVARRWLPAIGLADGGPPVLGSVAEPSGTCVWQVYDDLGGHELDTHRIDRESVSAAVALIAAVHTRFARHPLLGEVRLHGGDVGIHFYESNVCDAIYAVEACQPDMRHTRLHERLLQRLYALRRQLPARRQVLDEWGGPETLLHGDLGAINVFVVPRAGGLHARLIDWDHTAVGPATYDLSTFLLRLPRQYRHWVLDAYREQTERAGWSLPTAGNLNFLFETAEYARFANRMIWPAVALAQDRTSSGWDVLAEVDECFEQFQPVLPFEHERRSRTAALP